MTERAIDVVEMVEAEEIAAEVEVSIFARAEAVDVKVDLGFDGGSWNQSRR